MTTGAAIVFGAGAGLGAATVRRFRAGGLKTVAVSRNEAKLRGVFAGEPDVLCIAADATDSRAVADAIDQAEAEAGPLCAAIANSAAWKIAPLLEHSPEDFEAVWKQGSLAAFNILHHAGNRMAARGSGSILFTGSAAQMRAGSGFGPMAVAKLGLRALVQAGARELGPKGIHVGHVVVDGPIDSDRTRASNSDHSKLIDPAGIAEAFWFLHNQPRNAWTNELDIRTGSEWPAG
ncbi:MAG: SDR family NAD(P)-dependent oxidoreductase [Beijerinckiaceae bacterium]